jgi:diguanylate cyclase (GGDEF)-like protein/PAS domain S-box-containing protein
MTEEKRARLEADTAAARLSDVLESTTDSVFVLDKGWRITYRNRRAISLVGAGRDISTGRDFWGAFPEAVGSTFQQRYVFAMENQVAVEFEEYFAPLEMWFEVHAYPTPTSLSIFFRDVTDRRRVREKLLYLATHDALTGLANRHVFLERVTFAVSVAARGGAGVALLCVDLDGFKAINDTLGHLAGDAALSEIGQRLRSCASDGDTVARTGGDEFTIIQAALGAEDASKLAHRISTAMREPFLIAGQCISIGASIGIALAPRDALNPDELFRNADLALYRAKNEDPGTHRFFERAMDEQLQAHQALKVDLGGALSRDELELVFQPIIELESERICGLEALLRWRHPDLGLILPADFIPVSEETGLIVAIGEWVLEQACLEASRWPSDMKIAVNLSPLQFKRRSLPGCVARALASSGLEPNRLEVEITESVLLQDSETNLKLLQELKALGVEIALDDFGVGYSSLSYLRMFPFDKIKIDRCFIADLPDHDGSLAIVRAVLALGKSLKMTTTAEGVETARQLQTLRREGCTQAQGFLFSRPVPASAVLDLIGKMNGTIPLVRGSLRLAG